MRLESGWMDRWRLSTSFGTSIGNHVVPDRASIELWHPDVRSYQQTMRMRAATKRSDPARLLTIVQMLVNGDQPAERFCDDLKGGGGDEGTNHNDHHLKPYAFKSVKQCLDLSYTIGRSPGIRRRRRGW